MTTTYTVRATGISSLGAKSRSAAIKLAREMLREAAAEHGATVRVYEHTGERPPECIAAWAWQRDKFRRVNP